MSIQIASAGNSDTACLRLIFFKGYKVSVYYDEDSNNRGSTYTAIKDDNTYIAESPMELLGLITLGETWGEDFHYELGDPFEQIDYDDDDEI